MDIKAYIEITRPINSLMMALAVIIGAVIACNNLNTLMNNSLKILLGSLTAFTLTAASMVINDVYDIEVDRVNAPWRPIPSGRISIVKAKIYFTILCIIGIASALFINLLAMIIALASIIISYTYSAWGKRTGLLGNAMVSFCVAIPFIYGSVILYDSIIPITLFFFLMAFLANMGREVTKGIIDVEGDKLRHIRTIAIVYGSKKAAFIAVIFYLLAITLSIIPIILDLVSALYIPLIVITDLGFIYTSLLLLRNPYKEIALRSKRLVLLWMLIGMLAFLVGRISL